MDASSRARVYGVDFSGAKDAGKRIWIASGVIEGDELQIDLCCQAQDLPGSGIRRDRCLAALRDFIGREGGCVFGLDFPFGLPQEVLIKQRSWEDLVLSFPDEYADPDTFRQACRKAAQGRELKRVTDRESQTPFSPYNLRLYRQTYFGIRDVLHPLVRDGLACVLPMQAPRLDKPWVLEICPASTLKRERLYHSYKGNTDTHRAARSRILKALEATGPLSIPTPEIRAAALEDRGGDALDSVIAAFAILRTMRNPVSLRVEANGVGGNGVGSNDAYKLEGYVYV